MSAHHMRQVGPHPEDASCVRCGAMSDGERAKAPCPGVRPSEIVERNRVSSMTLDQCIDEVAGSDGPVSEELVARMRELSHVGSLPAKRRCREEAYCQGVADTRAWTYAETQDPMRLHGAFGRWHMRRFGY